MPELPEVETTRRGITPHMEGKIVDRVVIRQPQLRWPIPPDLADHLVGQKIQRIERRAKYLLLHTDNGSLILHLGMSGSLRILPISTPAEKHDHFDLCCGDTCLRLRDPRRFGAVLWTGQAPLHHPLLRELGPEPLSDEFSGGYLHRLSRKRITAIKSFIMDGKIVVGVGNIYANEALFMAGIHPKRQAGRISLERYRVLSDAIKTVLKAAIEQGGTTLKDFTRQDGKPGYFAQQLLVYGRGGEACPNCGEPLQEMRLGQRSTVFCRHCQH